MANPRRSGLQSQNPQQQLNPNIIPPSDQQQQSISSFSLSSIALFLKRPHAFPFLLSIFVLLTWLSLRFQNPHRNSPFSSSSSSSSPPQFLDSDANLARFSAVEAPSRIARDGRGWILDPVAAAQQYGIRGGAHSCASVHIGEIRPGSMRGNHRHHTCNETFIIWGGETKFRLENPRVGDQGYAEVSIGASEVVVAASPAGTAHALINVDRVRSIFFLGCQDSIIKYNSSTTDFNIWKDL